MPTAMSGNAGTRASIQGWASVPVGAAAHSISATPINVTAATSAPQQAANSSAWRRSTAAVGAAPSCNSVA